MDLNESINLYVFLLKRMFFVDVLSKYIKKVDQVSYCVCKNLSFKGVYVRIFLASTTHYKKRFCVYFFFFQRGLKYFSSAALCPLIDVMPGQGFTLKQLSWLSQETHSILGECLKQQTKQLAVISFFTCTKRFASEEDQPESALRQMFLKSAQHSAWCDLIT